ncbi:indole-3-glycerol phosphate synthase TrpC [Limibacter armeniacum]|uniref:indole-3-glycerol phosphate synthase TrpC n=1 Tax=Limibacter armeniacum TaxID=466084 RepID=UPI002FE53C94
MTILDKIIEHKIKEVATRKEYLPISKLEQRPLFDIAPLSAKAWVTSPNRSGIIAEFKRKSPSKGLINGNVKVSDVTSAYVEAGASAISVLTDEEFFGGSVDDLLASRGVHRAPLLRKDFVVDEYQLIEAKSIGADLVLLIAACLEPKKLKELAMTAKNLGLEVLMEVHNEDELKGHLNEHLDLVGVNNRNLKTFEVSVETSKRLSSLIPNEFLKISESGISDPSTIRELKDFGFDGFLIGENFMKTEDPGKACKEFIEAI